MIISEPQVACGGDLQGWLQKPEFRPILYPRSHALKVVFTFRSSTIDDRHLYMVVVVIFDQKVDHDKNFGIEALQHWEWKASHSQIEVGVFHGVLILHLP